MLTKNAFLEEIRKQYVLTARAKGLSERQVLWKHVLWKHVLQLQRLHGLSASRCLYLAGNTRSLSEHGS